MKALKFIFFPLLALGTGAFAGYLTSDSLETVYSTLDKSVFTPPGWVFPIVWTALYLLMGLGRAMVASKGQPKTARSVFWWCLQLALNFGWSLLFFNVGDYFAALVCLAALWIAILAMTISFAAVSRLAAWLQVPYLVWVGFAGYLNAAVWVLNR